jgi:hypothetical protein
MQKLPQQTRRVNVEQLVIDPNAEPPAEKFYQLCERKPDFQKTWDRRQGGKWTQETYEAKLAHYVTEDEWTKQEIANLIIAFRRKHSHSMKLIENFYLQIIARARLYRVCSTVDEARKEFSILIGWEIKKLQCYPTDKPIFVVTMEGWPRPIELADSNDLMIQERFRRVLNAYAKYGKMPTFKTAEWHQILSRMLEFVETMEISDEGTHLGSATHWLTGYIRDCIHVERVKDQRQAILDRKPGIMEDDVWFSMAGLRKYIGTEFGENPSAGDLSVRLQQLGCQFVDQKSFRTEDGKHHCRSLWRVGKAWPALIAKGLEHPCPKNLIAREPRIEGGSIKVSL